VKVLHVAHTATISGGEHSLLTLLARMPPELELGVACPEGPLAHAVRALGLPVHRMPGTSASFRLRPVHTARALAELGAAATAVRRIARREGATVLHANSVRAGLITGLAGTAGGPASVVHVRDVLPGGPTSEAVKRALASRSDALIAISRYVQERIAVARDGPPISVIDNPVDQARFDPALYDPAECRHGLGIRACIPVVGIVGQITPWKGHRTVIEALGIVRERHPRALLVVVGEIKFAGAATRLDNHGYLASLHALVETLGLGANVRFLGERKDVPRVLRALNALLVPSEAEPFGRTVAEAMTIGTPVIATSEGGPPELIEAGRSGLLAPPGDVRAWASAVNRVLDDRHAAQELTIAAREVALRRFDAKRHADAVMQVLALASAG
jgi:glycosyltransferase involved in cell wall biosynthesis